MGKYLRGKQSINPLFKDVKEYNKYLLSLIGVFTILVTGIISYSFTNISYAKWSDTKLSNNVLKFGVKSLKLDESGANEPLLTSNMIPVYYDEGSKEWKKADSSNKDENYKWYDYDNKIWANAVTVGSSNIIDDITKNKSVSLSNKTIEHVPYTTFISGGKGINNARSYIKITVNIKSGGTFGFRASVSSEYMHDQLTVSVQKNKDFIYHVLDGKTGIDSNTFSNVANAGDVYDIYAQYSKDDKGNENNDIAILDAFDYPANSVVTFTDSATAGGTSGQDWTASGGNPSGTGVLVGDSISYNNSTSKYDLNGTNLSTISNSLVGKYVCPNVSDLACETPYKIVDASSNSINKVDEYKTKTVSRDELLNSKVGTTISISNINTMWVWIPRYTYTYLSTNTPQEIKIKFEKDANSSGSIKCVNAINQKDSDGKTISEKCTDATNGGLKAGTSTYTHPAFWWDKNDNNVREEGEELTGIWIGKFEVSSGQIIKPNVTSLRSQTVNQLYTGIYNMRNSGNAFGFSTTDETHMMKNMEWGAVTYLSHSKYGINKEVAINSANTFTTGCGPQSAGSTTSGATCNSYTTTLGQSASTTGNVYGVYDMSGGANEYMMGNMVNSSGEYYGEKSMLSAPLARYYDKYSYGSSYTEYTRGKLGDATKELVPTGSYKGWYQNSGESLKFVSDVSPWFIRGASYQAYYSSIFYFSNGYQGQAWDNASTRAVISNLN